jgi:hypothetical protein
LQIFEIIKLSDFAGDFNIDFYYHIAHTWTLPGSWWNREMTRTDLYDLIFAHDSANVVE